MCSDEAVESLSLFRRLNESFPKEIVGNQLKAHDPNYKRYNGPRNPKPKRNSHGDIKDQQDDVHDSPQNRCLHPRPT